VLGVGIPLPAEERGLEEAGAPQPWPLQPRRVWRWRDAPGLQKQLRCFWPAVARGDGMRAPWE
jgi:hypothetical protein